MNLVNDGIGSDNIVTIAAMGASPVIKINGILEAGAGLSMSTSAQYNGDLTKEVTEGAIKTGAAKIGLGGIVSAVAGSIKTKVSTRKGYLEGDGGDFSITLLFFLNVDACGNFQSYRHLVEELSKLTLPKYIDGGIMTSHIYKSSERDSSQLIQVSIGKWFDATGLFCKSGSFDFSPHKDQDGKPMFLRWSGSFEYKEAPDASTVAKWYK